MYKTLQLLLLGSLFSGCYAMEQEQVLTDGDDSAVESEGEEINTRPQERPSDPIEWAKKLVAEDEALAKDVPLCVRKLNLAMPLAKIQELGTETKELKEDWEDGGERQKDLEEEVKALEVVINYVAASQESYSKELARIHDGKTSTSANADELKTYLRILGLVVLQIDTPLSKTDERRRHLKELHNAVQKIPYKGELDVEEIIVNEKNDDTSSEELVIISGTATRSKEKDEVPSEDEKDTVEQVVEKQKEDQPNLNGIIDPELLAEFKMMAGNGSDEDEKEQLRITPTIKSDALAERYESFDEATITELQVKNANLVLTLTDQLIGLAKAKYNKVDQERQELKEKYKKSNEKLKEARGKYQLCQELLKQLKQKFPEVFEKRNQTPQKKK